MKDASSRPAVECFRKIMIYGSCGDLRVIRMMVLMLVHKVTQDKGVNPALSCELEGDVDDTFPIDGMTRCVGGRLEASCLYGTNGRVSKPVAEVAGDTKDLDRTGGGDTKANGDGAFDGELDGFGGVLGTRLEENPRRGLGGRRRSRRLGDGRGRVLGEIDRSSNAARRAQRSQHAG